MRTNCQTLYMPERQLHGMLSAVRAREVHPMSIMRAIDRGLHTTVYAGEVVYRVARCQLIGWLHLAQSHPPITLMATVIVECGGWKMPIVEEVIDIDWEEGNDNQ